VWKQPRGKQKIAQKHQLFYEAMSSGILGKPEAKASCEVHRMMTHICPEFSAFSN